MNPQNQSIIEQIEIHIAQLEKTLGSAVSTFETQNDITVLIDVIGELECIYSAKKSSTSELNEMLENVKSKVVICPASELEALGQLEGAA